MSARSTRPMCAALQSCGAVLFLTLAANATEYYVDAVNGNDANVGTTPATAWRTITHALSQLPVPSTGVIDVVHVAPGTYDAALGEQFPLRLMGHDAVQIVGDGGPQATILDGGGASSVIFSWPDAQVANWGTGPDTLVQGLTLTHATDGIRLGANRFRSTYLTCRDLIISQMSGHAVSANSGFTMSSQNQLWLTCERVVVRQCQEGILVATAVQSSTQGHANVTLVDCTISNCRARGVLVSDVGFDSNGSNLTMRRCRVTDNVMDGVRIVQSTSATHATTTEFQDCLIARNGAAGVNAVVGPGLHKLFTTVRRCTIADNAGVGLDTFYTPFGGFTEVVQTTLSSSILYGNGDDVSDNPAWPTITDVSFNDIGDGDYAGSNGNIALDPLFRDAPNGDWRLVWGSPCVDVGGSTSFPLDARDLLGANRNIDGDLDTLRQNDMGAFEFAPLWPTGTPHLGQPFALEQWGSAGSSAMLLAVRGKGLATPVPTMFGDLFVHLPYSRNLGSTPAAPGPPALRVLTIPANPIYIGQVVTFQALTTSTVPASAYTNAVTVTIVP